MPFDPQMNLALLTSTNRSAQLPMVALGDLQRETSVLTLEQPETIVSVVLVTP